MSKQRQKIIDEEHIAPYLWPEVVFQNDFVTYSTNDDKKRKASQIDNGNEASGGEKKYKTGEDEVGAVTDV